MCLSAPLANHMLGLDHFVFVVEVKEVASQLVNGTDGKMRSAQIDEIEIDEVEKRLLE